MKPHDSADPQQPGAAPADPAAQTLLTRRDFMAQALIGGAVLATACPAPAMPADPATWPLPLPQPPNRSAPMPLTCFIRYEIDPFQREAFKEYAQNWGRIIPRCGGHLVGYFLPYEGSNYVAWGLIAFDGLAAYEAYRARLRADPEARKNFAFAQDKRFILREERSFPEVVEGTFGIAPEKA